MLDSSRNIKSMASVSYTTWSRRRTLKVSGRTVRRMELVLTSALNSATVEHGILGRRAVTR